jgi:chromosomal replication initiator protein
MEIKTLLKAVCDEFSITEKRLRNKGRERNNVNARIVYCYVLRTQMSLTYNQIGALVGKRDHTTIYYYVEKFKELCMIDKAFKYQANKVLKNLNIDEI